MVILVFEVWTWKLRATHPFNVVMLCLVTKMWPGHRIANAPMVILVFEVWTWKLRATHPLNVMMLCIKLYENRFISYQV